MEHLEFKIRESFTDDLNNEWSHLSKLNNPSLFQTLNWQSLWCEIIQSQLKESTLLIISIYYNKKVIGILDKKFASLVNKKTCLQIAKNINLEKYILTFNPKNRKIKIEDKVIADCLEAIIGGIYLDKGLLASEKFILNLWKDHVKASIITEIDSKTQLQEYSLKLFKTLPLYKLISNTGPRHKPSFKVGVKLNNTKFFKANGSSKKDAEQNAATKCLESIFKS